MLTLDQIVEKLKAIVGPRFVSTNPIDKINYQHTLAYGAYKALPDVIVRVESDAAGDNPLAKILSFASEHKVPIVAKGGVGMGISSPLKGGILLDMLGMDKVVEVNPRLQYVVAEGGASVYAIHHALRQHGLMLPNFGTYEQGRHRLRHDALRLDRRHGARPGSRARERRDAAPRRARQSGHHVRPVSKMDPPAGLPRHVHAGGRLARDHQQGLPAGDRGPAGMAPRLLLHLPPRPVGGRAGGDDEPRQRRGRLRHPLRRSLAVPLADGGGAGR